MARSTFVCSLVVACFVVVGCMAEEDWPNGEESVGQLGQALSGGKLCMSSIDCGDGWYCTTADGDCFSPPGCRNRPCLAVCYGRCAKVRDVVTCGPGVCAPGQVCCNESCGICTEPGGFCTMQVCSPIATF